MYVEKYFKVIDSGLKNSIYQIEDKLVDSESFFNDLVLLTKNIKKNNGRLFFFGNGASAAFSNHMALDWSKNGGVLSFSFSDSSMLTAFANDYSYEDAFVEFLKINNPSRNDLIVTTSSSGNSENIVKILEYCNLKRIKTLALSGLNYDNKSISMSNFSIFVPMKTYGVVECIHQLFHHIWLDKYMGIEEWNKTESQNMDSNNFKL